MVKRMMDMQKWRGNKLNKKKKKKKKAKCKKCKCLLDCRTERQRDVCVCEMTGSKRNRVCGEVSIVACHTSNHILFFR